MSILLQSQFAPAASDELESDELLIYASQKALAYAQAEAAWLIKKAASQARYGRWSKRLQQLNKALPAEGETIHPLLLKKIKWAEKQIAQALACWHQEKPNQFKLPKKLFWITGSDARDLLEMDHAELMSYACYSLIPESLSKSAISMLAYGLIAGSEGEDLDELISSAQLAFFIEEPTGAKAYLQGQIEIKDAHWISFDPINLFEAKLSLSKIFEDGAFRAASIGELAAWQMINADGQKSAFNKKKGWAQQAGSCPLERAANKLINDAANERGLDPAQFCLKLLDAPAKHAIKDDPFLGILNAKSKPQLPAIAKPEKPMRKEFPAGKEGQKQFLEAMEAFKEAAAAYRKQLSKANPDMEMPIPPDSHSEARKKAIAEALESLNLQDQEILSREQAKQIAAMLKPMKDAEWEAFNKELEAYQAGGDAFIPSSIGWAHKKFLAISDAQDLIQAAIFIEGADAPFWILHQRMRFLLQAALREASKRRSAARPLIHAAEDAQHCLEEMDPLMAAMSQSSDLEPELEMKQIAARWMKIWEMEPSLSGKQIQALELRLIHGLNQQEIAEIMGCAQRSASELLLKAKPKALQALADSGEEAAYGALKRAIAEDDERKEAQRLKKQKQRARKLAQ
jgi:DNA-directed RNA polymerase specialized sigma24 family protein